MRLEFKSEFQSIKQFEPVEMADFSILTGVNGSGKTHLLKALKNGNAQIDSIQPEDTVFFDFIQFKVDNEADFSREQLILERRSAWDFFTKSNIPSFGILKNLIFNAKNSHLSQDECDVLKTISKEKNKSILSVDEDDIINNDELKNKFEKYKENVRKIFSHKEIKNHPYKQSIDVLSQKLQIFLDEITEVEFKDDYVPTYLKENFLPIQIGKIFLDYRVKEYEEFHKSCDIAPMKYPLELKQKSEQKCREMYGGFTPWEILNDLLNAYGTFEYTITYPEEFITGVYSHQSESTFIPKLINAEKNISINYDQLSSGEQILFSLALCLFKGKSDKIFPKLLLLDEIDASLHPSMIENLLRVIQEVLLKKDTKVILATHSPTTIAIAPEQSIFVVNKSGEKRIEKRDKKDALEILTQGYMTMEKGFKLFDQISKKEISIISEGNNGEYIEKAADLFAGNNRSKIEVIKELESISGESQLKTLFDFFTLVNHNNKVFVVFDWDSKKESLKEKNNTYPYVFEKNDSNKIAKKGIENLLDEELFDEFTKTITDDSTKEATKTFNAKRKKDFSKHICSIADTNNLKNLKPLFDYIDSKIKNE